MNQRQIRKKTRKMVNDHYDHMIKLIKKTAKEYSVERVPLVFVNQIIDKAKLKEKFDIVELEAFRLKFNELNDLLKKECKKLGKTTNDNCITVFHFANYVNILREAFDKGQREIVK